MSIPTNIYRLGQQSGEQDRTSKYDPKHCDLIQQLAQDGKFPAAGCAAIGVTRKTLYNWADRYEDFEDAIEMAWQHLHAYWTEFAVRNL